MKCQGEPTSFWVFMSKCEREKLLQVGSPGGAWHIARLLGRAQERRKDGEEEERVGKEIKIFVSDLDKSFRQLCTSHDSHKTWAAKN